MSDKMEANSDPTNQSFSNHKALMDEKSLLLAQERTRLAAERTFLSWIRTGLTGVAGGLAVARLILFRKPENQFIANLVGELLILWGIAAFVFAFLSYRRTSTRFQQQTFYSTLIWQIALLVLSLIVLAFLLFWILMD